MHRVVHVDQAKKRNDSPWKQGRISKRLDSQGVLTFNQENEMEIQRLRNLTTGRLHTEIGHVYQDIEFFTGEAGIFTHMLPNAHRAAEPWLKEQFQDPRLWDGAYDVTHTGQVEAHPMDDEAKKAFFVRYAALQNPLFG